MTPFELMAADDGRKLKLGRGVVRQQRWQVWRDVRNYNLGLALQLGLGAARSADDMMENMAWRS